MTCIKLTVGASSFGASNAALPLLTAGAAGSKE
jgi:hypothetical protein